MSQELQAPEQLTGRTQAARTTLERLCAKTPKGPVGPRSSYAAYMSGTPGRNFDEREYPFFEAWLSHSRWSQAGGK